MKILLPSILIGALLASSSLAGNWFGAGPWANYGPYPGYLNGKYTGIVTAAEAGSVISGVVGFAIVDGAPPFRIEDDQASSGGDSPVPIINQQIEPDPVQNFFAIFVEGRTYTGLTWPAVDLESNQVVGTLQGRNPAGFLPIGTGATQAGAAYATNATEGTIVFDARDATSILNRGLSGGFNANILTKNALFNFQGNGRLSTPANRQTYTITATPLAAPGFPLNVPVGTITNEVVTAIYETESTPFNIRGIRTSYITANPAALRDARELQQVNQN